MSELTPLQQAFADWVGPYLATHEDGWGWRFSDVRAAFEAGYGAGQRTQEIAP